MRIINYYEYDKGCLRASFDVIIEEWGITIKRCGYFIKGDHSWIGFPTQKYQEADGTTKFSPYIFMEKTRKARFDKTALDLILAGKYEVAEKRKASVFEEPPVEDNECPF